MNRAAQLLQTCTAFIRSAPVSPVHIRIFSIQDILGLPQPHFPSTRPVIKLPSILSHDCLIMCPKLQSNVSFVHERVATVHFWLLLAYYILLAFCPTANGNLKIDLGACIAYLECVLRAFFWSIYIHVYGPCALKPEGPMGYVTRVHWSFRQGRDNLCYE